MRGERIIMEKKGGGIKKEGSGGGVKHYKFIYKTSPFLFH
jgi:hypothetical protein